MQSCKDMELLINLCLDDMLPSQEMEELQAHLKICPACREKYAQLRELKTALGKLEEPVPEDLHQRILAYVEKHTTDAIEQKTAPKKVLRPRYWYRGLAAVAACAVIAVTAVRFMPAVGRDTAESLVSQSQKPDVLYDTAIDESENMKDSTMTDTILPDTPAAQSPGMPENQQSVNVPPAMMGMNPQENGQMAEDLPPLRQENDSAAARQESSIRKWLKAVGEKTRLPECVDADFIYETQLDGQTVSYVEIAVWAEDYWTDQLLACGFSIEDMEGENLSEEGEYLLIFFFWTE